MTDRLNVLFLPLPFLFERWGDDVVAALSDHSNLRIADYDQPWLPNSKISTTGNRRDFPFPIVPESSAPWPWLTAP